VSQLVKLLPADLKTRVYNEPFAGSAALGLHVMHHHLAKSPFYLSDANWQISNAHRSVLYHYPMIDGYLRDMELRYSFEPRETFKENVSVMQDQSYDPWDRAAAFICVQQMSFNGLWRVNSKGRYNVPFGKRTSINLPSYEHLFLAKSAMHPGMVAENISAESAIAMGEGLNRPSFWYIDPPYLAEASEHTRYMPQDFKRADHEQLIADINTLVKGDAKVMISASNSNESFNFYKEKLASNWWMTTVSVQRSISAKARGRKAVTELVFTNYNPVFDHKVE
jgi:DNA adenine methylase